jgi:amino acid adenylation domain-containing protein
MPPGSRVPVPRVQQRLWLADQLTPHRAVYVSNLFLRLRGRLHVPAIEAALRAVVTRHEVLRTSLRTEDGDLYGLLRPAAGVTLPVQDATGDEADAIMRTEAAEPLDLADGLPLRARLIRIGAEHHILCLAVHHTAIDLGSVTVLRRELAEYYEAAVAGDAAGIEPAPLDRQFRDIAVEADERFDHGDIGADLAERVAALRGLVPFELPPDRPRPATRSGEGVLRHAFTLTDDVTRGLTRLAGSRRATLFMVLLAACHTVLYRYTGRTDVSTGTSSSTRAGAADAAAIGPFLNMLVVPGDLGGNPAFAELVARVRDRTLDAYESRQVPFDSVVAELGLDRDPSRTPLFQILVEYKALEDLPALPGLTVEELPTPGSGAKYDLTVDFRPSEDGLRVYVEWDTALYRADTVERLMAHLDTVLAAAAADPGTRIDDLPMISAAESERLLELAGGPPRRIPGTSLHDLVLEQARRTPEAVAIQDATTCLTYAELDARATVAAHGLRALGVGLDTPVGVLLDRSVDQVVAVLGILKAGGAFLPIDPETPPARVATLLTAAAAPVCLVPDATEPVPPGPCRFITLAGLPRDAEPGELPVVRPAQLCAVYFTSGSTGEPKGVACTHRGWIGQMADMQSRYRLEAGETLLLKTPLSFDDAAREVFWPLTHGGRVVVLPPGEHRDPRAIVEAATAHQVVWLQFVPSMLALFLDEIAPEHRPGLRRLRHVVSDGDRLRPAMVRTFFEKLGDPIGCRLNNHWGTTEVSIDTTHHVCVPADRDGDDAVVIGRPMEDHVVRVLDRTLRPVPYGAVGELCIGGAGLARGYLGSPGRTARAFVPDPWRPGQRLYRTGDTGRLLPDGSLRYCGRRDHQVKVRGVRIELGDVEASVRAFPSVTDATVAVWEPVAGDTRLVAYVVLPEQDRAALRDFLAGRLASWAVPSVIIALTDLPRMPSGKVDHRSLPPVEPNSLRDRPFVAPETDAERAVADVWGGVLGVERVGADDSFFALGGHSLLVTRAVNRMRAVFGIDVPIRLVFEHSTVRAAAARIEELVIADIGAMTEEEAETEFRQTQEVVDVH